MCSQNSLRPSPGGSPVRWCDPCFLFLYRHCQVCSLFLGHHHPGQKGHPCSFCHHSLGWLSGPGLWRQCGEKALSSYPGLRFIPYFLKQFSKLHSISSIQEFFISMNPHPSENTICLMWINNSNDKDRKLLGTNGCFSPHPPTPLLDLNNFRDLRAQSQSVHTWSLSQLFINQHEPQVQTLHRASDHMLGGQETNNIWVCRGQGASKKRCEYDLLRAYKSASFSPPFLPYAMWHIGFSNNKDKLFW